MPAILMNEWVIIGALVVFGIVSLVGFGRTRRWLFGSTPKTEEKA